MKRSSFWSVFCCIGSNHRCIRLRGCLSLLSALLLPVLASAAVEIDDPIGYFDFSGENFMSNKAIEVSQYDASVLAGTPLSGVYTGMSGIAGDALVLDGSSAIELQYSQDTLGRSFTIACWYMQVSSETRMTIFQTSQNVSLDYDSVRAGETSFVSYIANEAIGEVVTPLGEWVHVAHTVETIGDTVTLKVYINGAHVLARSTSAAKLFEDMRIFSLRFGANRNAANFLKGMIDEIALYSRTLSDDDVYALYQRGLAGESLTPELPSGVHDFEGMGRFFSVGNVMPAEPGVHQLGWMLDRGNHVGPPLTLGMADTAARVDDTAEHEDGPFHGYLITRDRFCTEITPSGIGSITEGDFTIETRFLSRETGRGILMGSYKGGAGVRAINLELHEGNKVRLYLQPSTANRANVDINVTPQGIDVRDGEWHHLAGRREGDVCSLWLDGVLLQSVPDKAGSFVLNGDFFYLKGDQRTDTTLFDGDLEASRLWKRALSAEEIADLAAGIQPVGELARMDLLLEYSGTYAPYNAAFINPGYSIALDPPIANITMGDFSLETWFRTTDTGRGVLVGNYGPKPSCANLELNVNNQVRLYLEHDKVIDNLNVVAKENRDGNWHHLAGVRQGGHLYLYLDGEMVGNMAGRLGAYTLNNEFMFFSRDTRTGITQYNGDFKNLRLWSRALDSDEVEMLASGSLPGDNGVSITGMLAEYTCNQSEKTLYSAGMTSSHFYRTTATGSNILTLLFENLPLHHEISIGAYLAQLDSLDPVRDGDHFAIKVDGTEVLKVGLGFGREPPYSEPNVGMLELFGQPADTNLMMNAMIKGGEDIFWSGTTGDLREYKEHVYDLSRVEALQKIPHKSRTLKVELIGVHDQKFDSEGFGLDKIKLAIPAPNATLIMVK